MAKYKFYTMSFKAWEAMLEAIKGAKESIYWESYIFYDVKKFDFFKVLKDKARSGVEVKIIFDSLGSFFLTRKNINSLRRAGVEVLFYNRLLPWWNPNRFKYWWFHRNHKKILIIDKKIGFVGGVNVGTDYKNWRDLQVELRGRVVNYLVRTFAVSYELSGGRDQIYYHSFLKSGKVRVFHHSPMTERGILKKFYKQSLRSASHKISIVTPYFLPQAWLVKEIKRALKRGVKIEVILPKKTDYWITDVANYCLASLVYREGISFFFTENMTHAKALLVDEREAMVGSQNIDAYSFDYNLEAGIVFEQKDMIRRLKSIFEQWKKTSIEMTFIDKIYRRWYFRLWRAFLSSLSQYL